LRTPLSARKALQPYGANDDKMFAQPLATMLPDQAIRLVINWLLMNAGTGQKIELLVFEPSEQKIYTSNLAIYRGRVFVQRFREHPAQNNEIYIFGNHQSIINCLLWKK